MAEKKTIKKPQAWQIRKIAYGLAAILVGVLGWAGVLSDIKADEIMAHVDQWLPILLGVLAPALAASKTHEGSDSTATEADVESVTTTVADRVQDAVRDALTTAASIDPTQIGQAVVTAIRAEERGDHDATATASTDYVYGR
ncbi:hypothetical protein [Corynebacterium neomassiliense]|uniref:hypothetical protein n=1 Tax=Corynebacterium neomassiliense TaxID=2079482 RepID=UPI0010314B82|nr:hypothetical protein [Corynebacterium neomassiliense]